MEEFNFNYTLLGVLCKSTEQMTQKQTIIDYM